MEQLGVDDQLQRKGYRGHPLSKADLVRNKEIAVIRSGGERPFAIYKSHYGLARTQLMGLAKNITLCAQAVIAHNIAKEEQFLALYGLPDLEPTEKVQPKSKNNA